MPRKPLIKCGVEGCTYAHARSQVVGMHRRLAHGIEGTSPASLSAKRLSAKRAMGVKKDKVRHDEISKQQPIEVIAYTLGRIDQLILSVAVENDIAPKQLAGWCAEHIRNQTGR